jgi:iron(III) transport system ATP-binding protein
MGATDMAFLTVSSVSKQGFGDFMLHAISFFQRQNEKLAIAGETGSGKSTLLRVVAGLEQVDSGEVKFQQQNVIGPAESLIPGHPGIAYLSQDFALPKFLRVEQVLEYANHLHPQKAASLFDVCEITHLLERKTDELSGGERQRIALTRLLITSPQLILLDEPFSNLDMMHRSTLKNVLRKIYKQLNITCILVSHDPADVLSWADRIVVLKNGFVVQQGDPKELYRKPVDEYTAGLFGAYNLVSVRAADSFHKLWETKSSGKRYIVRPEDMKIVKKKGKALKGIVTHVAYFGSYYEIEVAFDNDRYLIRRKNAKVGRGDVVYFKCSMNRAWPLPTASTKA